MIEIYRLHEHGWQLVERVKEHEYIRSDLMDEIAMIDAAGGQLNNVGMRATDMSDGATTYFLSSDHDQAEWVVPLPPKT